MMKSPLAIVLGLVFKEHRIQYACENNISENEVISLISNRCALAEITIKSMDSANYVPSAKVATRLIESGVFMIGYANLMLYLGILERIGSNLSSEKAFNEKCNIAIEISQDDDFNLIIDMLKDINWLEINSFQGLKRKIYDSGVFKAAYNFLSHKNYIRRKRTKYHADFASRNELEWIYETEKRLLPDSYQELDYFISRWDHNNRIFTIIYKNKDKLNRLGHFKLYPLSDEYVTDILKGSVSKASKYLNATNTDHLARSFQDSSALGIGVAGVNEYASGIILSEMFSHIKILIQTSKISMLFTSSRSKEGQHLMDKFGFKRVAGSDLSVLALTEDKLAELGIERALKYS